MNNISLKDAILRPWESVEKLPFTKWGESHPNQVDKLQTLIACTTGVFSNAVHALYHGVATIGRGIGYGVLTAAQKTGLRSGRMPKCVKAKAVKLSAYKTALYIRFALPTAAIANLKTPTYILDRHIRYGLMPDNKKSLEEAKSFQEDIVKQQNQAQQIFEQITTSEKQCLLALGEMKNFVGTAQEAENFYQENIAKPLESMDQNYANFPKIEDQCLHELEGYIFVEMNKEFTSAEAKILSLKMKAMETNMAVHQKALIGYSTVRYKSGVENINSKQVSEINRQLQLVTQQNTKKIEIEAMQARQQEETQQKQAAIAERNKQIQEIQEKNELRLQKQLAETMKTRLAEEEKERQEAAERKAQRNAERERNNNLVDARRAALANPPAETGGSWFSFFNPVPEEGFKIDKL